jgi:pimeloyl-ACP methyl ester carboxylesterase
MSDAAVTQIVSATPGNRMARIFRLGVANLSMPQRLLANFAPTRRLGRSVDRWWMVLVVLAGLALPLAACAPPIQVERADPDVVRQELNANVISTGDLSEPTLIVLRFANLSDRFAIDPEGTIEALHQTLSAGPVDPAVLFALAEMAFHRAQETGKRPYFLAAAIYAYAALFPDNPRLQLSAFDPRVRTACEIYNRGLKRAFASADGSRTELHSGTYELPFGHIDIVFDSAGARWGNKVLSNFIATDELRVTGLDIRYRRPGIGLSLAADATPQVQEAGFQVKPEVKVPVTALLRIDSLPRNLAQGHLRGSVEVHPAFEPSDVIIAGQTVPLASDTSAAYAFSLSDPKVWRSEFAGFLDGTFFDRAQAQLTGLAPYRPGQIPVVFIHGTGSSSGRWANLINDLQGDPVIREKFQFWSFTYATGNPTSYSAAKLREDLQAAVQSLDPQRKDPALRQIVLIGHSQGGLLAKWLVIDSGSRLWDVLSNRPPEELRVSPETSALLRRVFFVTPEPDVRRVIFIATPHHGSFLAEGLIGQLAARLITPGARILLALRELTDDTAYLSFNPGSLRAASIWSMSRSNPLLQALAAIPVAPQIAAHSIIAVRGNGPIETGDDGVVSYQSAHIPEAVSELVIRSGHSVQSDPRAVNEVRRILLLHLAQACPRGCLPPTSAPTLSSIAAPSDKLAAP